MNYSVATAGTSAAFVGASVYTMLSSSNSQISTNYINSLTPKQKLLYDSTVKERTSLYITGLLLGILAASLYLYVNSDSDKVMTHAAIATAIIFVVQFLYYSLMPKRIYMLKYLTTKRQVNGWLKTYLQIKKRYFFGMMLGIIGFFIIGYQIMNRNAGTSAGTGMSPNMITQSE